MFLVIELRDIENNSQKSVKLEFQKQDTTIELQNKIVSEFGIPKQCQQIFDNNSRQIDLLFDQSFENAGIRHNEILILKHADLGWWEKYKECADSVLKQCSEKVELAKSAVKYHKLLMERDFFEFYPQYDNFQKEKHSEIASWTDGEDVPDHQATEKYFHNLHDQKRGDEDSEFICYFKNREGESVNERNFFCYSTDTVAFVRIHGEDSVSKYHINYHYYEGTYSGQLPDVTELYIYKLLELIGVGFKCHIIPRTISTGTKSSTYIANQWDEKFESLEELIDDDSLSADVVVQLSMLRMLFFITNLYERNCGRWKGTENVAVLDFAPTDNFTVLDSWKYELMKCVVDRRWMDEYYDVKSQHDDNSWLKIAKIYFDKWDISSKIRLAREQFDPTGELIKSLEMDFKSHGLRDTPTVELNEYIDILSKNVENFGNFLNSIL